ncbi:MAG: proton-conducting transporter membrane subunit, partial [Candidatus Omnitrophota bacterium]
LLAGNAMIEDKEQRFNFANLLLIALAGMNGIAMVQDIFSLYIFLEITAIVSFVLIAFDKGISALEGAFKYIVLSTVATVLMLSSIALFLVIAGSTDFAVVAGSLKASPDVYLAMFAIAVFLCGLFIKGGLMPFHGWLPDAYSSAPAPVSILLAGIVTKTVGIYTILRLVSAVFGFGPSLKQVLMLVGVFSIVVGAFAAMTQKDFKRMLAYSSISQVGYIVLGFGCGTTLGIAGAVFHIFNHAIFKSLLFVNAAAVEKQTGLKDMDKMSGLAARMPLTGTASIVASLSAAGIPPLAGFWSKFMIIVALWMSRYYGYATIAILASVVTLGYLLTMQRKIFFGNPDASSSSVQEAPFSLSLAAVVLSAIIIGAGLFFPYILKVFIFPAAYILGMPIR